MKCASCREKIGTRFPFGLGGLAVVTCQVCGEEVCTACAQQHLERATFFRHHPNEDLRARKGRREILGLACLSCIWTWQNGRGYEPTFPKPKGLKRKEKKREESA